MTITGLFITRALFAVGFTRSKGDTHDYKSSWQYAHQSAVKYRRQRDHLQALLTVRVLQVRRLRRTLARRRYAALHKPDVLEAIRLAAIAYHVDYGLLERRARCESVLSATAKNPRSSASGLFQFLTSTWASTPYGRESIWSPYSNAMAAAWMVANRRGNEWVCQ